MARTRRLPDDALQILALIQNHGIYVWVRGEVLIVNDGARTRVRPALVDELADVGYLVEDPDELTLHVTSEGCTQLEQAGYLVDCSSCAQ